MAISKRRLEKVLTDAGLVKLGQRTGYRERTSSGFDVYSHTSTDEWWICAVYPRTLVEEMTATYSAAFDAAGLTSRIDRTYVIVPKGSKT